MDVEIAYEDRRADPPTVRVTVSWSDGLETAARTVAAGREWPALEAVLHEAVRLPRAEADRLAEAVVFDWQATSVGELDPAERRALEWGLLGRMALISIWTIALCGGIAALLFWIFD